MWRHIKQKHINAIQNQPLDLKVNTDPKQPAFDTSNDIDMIMSMSPTEGFEFFACEPFVDNFGNSSFDNDRFNGNVTSLPSKKQISGIDDCLDDSFIEQTNDILETNAFPVLSPSEAENVFTSLTSANRKFECLVSL